MARKLTFALSLLVLVGLMTGISFANAIEIDLGPQAPGSKPVGSITVSPTAAVFTNVHGTAAQFGGLGTGTWSFLNGNIPVTSVNGPVHNLANNSEAITVDIGSDVLNGNFRLTSFQTATVGSVQFAYFSGFFNVTGATSGFANSGFAVGSTSAATFTTDNGKFSVGELLPTPEPATFALVGSGLLAAAGFLRRKR